MALVVFLRGVNVGGHKAFRPSALAKSLEKYGVVNVGAAGTFVVTRPVSQATLRAELRRCLPFETEVMICQGRDILDLASGEPFAGGFDGPDIVRFLSILAKGPCKNKFGFYGAGISPAGEAGATSIPRQWVCKERATKPAGERPSQKGRSYFCTVPKAPRVPPQLPLTLPPGAGENWLVRIVAIRGRFAFGVYRRALETIALLAKLDKLLGGSVTTRNWNTITKLVETMGGSRSRLRVR